MSFSGRISESLVLANSRLDDHDLVNIPQLENHMTKVGRIILEIDLSTCGADCNLDGDIDVLDMTGIARIILGLD